MKDEELRGTFPVQPERYGTSVLGQPLEVWLPEGGGAPAPARVLVFAGIHGEEPETTVALSRAVRSLGGVPPGAAVVLAANPDGLTRGTRGNANGVDLNRNFPTADWRGGTVTHRWMLSQPSRVLLGTGDGPASEPEASALVGLVERLKPESIVALHGPLGCIDDPARSELGRWLAKATAMPHVDDVGYPTPGSFGTWGRENGHHVVTYEFPPASLEALFHHHVAVIARVLDGTWCGGDDPTASGPGG